MYNKECQYYMKNYPGITVTKYQVAALTAKPYMKSLTAESLTSAFRKTGIFPFNNSVITDSQAAPASIYRNDENDVSQENKDSEQQEKPAVSIPSKTQAEVLISSNQITDSCSLNADEPFQ